MDSKDLAKVNFSGWATFNRAHKGPVVDNLPELAGVYAIRRKWSQKLRTGYSDVIYIGCAANQEGLRKRVQEYYHPGPTQSTCKRINGLVMLSDEYDLSFAVAPDADYAVRWERALLNAFRLDHEQLPPENRRSALAMSRDEVTSSLKEMAIYPQPDWSTYYERGECSVCGISGRFLLGGGNDPFYKGPYLEVCDCGAPVCGETDCDEQHAGC